MGFCGYGNAAKKEPSDPNSQNNSPLSFVNFTSMVCVCVCVCVCVVEDEAREDRQFKVQDGQLGQGLGVRGVSNNCGRDGTCVCKAVPVYARDYA